MKKSRVIVMCLLSLTLAAPGAEIGFSGDVSLVSTYVWRGVKQFNGAAVQSTAECSYGFLTLGYWVSSMNDSLTVETDPYIGVALPTGPVATLIGATVYSYDFFAKREYTVYELFATAEYGPFSVGFFYTPIQEEAYVDDALYWVDLSAGAKVFGADLSATLSYGNYSAWSAEENAANLLLSVGKSITDEMSISWNWNIALSDGPENVFFLSAGYGF